MKENNYVLSENTGKITISTPRRQSTGRKSRKAKPSVLITTNAHYIGNRSMSAAFEQALTLPRNMS